MRLSPADVETFRRDGVVIAANVVTDADYEPVIAAINAHVDRHARDLLAAGKITDLHADEPFETRIGLLYNQSPEITHNLDIMSARLPEVFAFLFNPNLLDAIESLIGPEITCNPIQHLRAKVPVTGDARAEGLASDVPWHQDAGVTWEEADHSEIVTCWMPLVHATRERGCMEVIPNCARLGFLEHVGGPYGSQIREDLIPTEGILCAECPKGGAVLMNRFTPHRGLTNRSDTVRWTLDLRYQPTGTPTGRPFHPAFVVRSRKNPASVMHDYAEWCRLWDVGLKRGKGIPGHRVGPPDRRVMPPDWSWN